MGLAFYEANTAWSKMAVCHLLQKIIVEIKFFQDCPIRKHFSRQGASQVIVIKVYKAKKGYE